MKAKRVAVVVGLVLLLSALTGCSSIQKGYVYDKHYSPAWKDFIPGFTTENCEKVGKKEDCEPVYHPAVQIFHSERWELDISDCTPQQVEQQNNNCQTNLVDVSEGTYNKYNVGDYVDLSNL